MKKQSIAVIGQGFVGGTLTTVFYEHGFDVYAYDKADRYVSAAKSIRDPKPSMVTNGRLAGEKNDIFIPVRTAPDSGMPDSLLDLVSACEEKEDFSRIYFVCLPTPMFEDGSADLSIVENTLQELSKIAGPKCPACRGSGSFEYADGAGHPCTACVGRGDLRERIAVVKSTVPPGSTERWNKMFGDNGLHVVFNPEFLTEANALEDMRNQNRIILGGPRPWVNSVKQVFQTAFPKVPLIKTSSTTAEMVKYMTNCFLSVKVSFANEMAQVCEALDSAGLNVDYDKVVEYARYDHRLGNSHWAVPGPDGARGFGGHCFPKDLNALMYEAEQMGLNMNVLRGAWQKNLEVRQGKDRDWERMEGRAVSKKKSQS